MVKSYCVKQKKQTECVPGSEKYVKTKNGRTMMKCTCAECGITEAKFVKSQSTGSSTRRGGNVTQKPYCGIKKPPKGRYLGDWEECKNQVRYYGLETINPEILNKWEQERKAKTTKARNVKKVVSKENIKKMKELAKKKKELNKAQKQLGLN